MRIHVYYIFLFVYRNKSTLIQPSLLPFVPVCLLDVGLQCARFIFYFFLPFCCALSFSAGATICTPNPPLGCPTFLSSALLGHLSILLSIVLQTAGGSMANWIMGQQSTFLSLPLASIYSRQRLLSAPGPRSGPALLSCVWVFMLCVLGLAPIPHQSSACEGELRAQTGFNHLYRRKKETERMFTIRLITQINLVFVLKCFSKVSKYKHLEKLRQFTVIVTFFLF